MDQPIGACFDPETIELLRKVLDAAWDALPASRKEITRKTELAERILAAAALGERDPERLKTIALMRSIDAAAASRASILHEALTPSG